MEQVKHFIKTRYGTEKYDHIDLFKQPNLAKVQIGYDLISGNVPVAFFVTPGEQVDVEGKHLCAALLAHPQTALQQVFFEFEDPDRKDIDTDCRVSAVHLILEKRDIPEDKAEEFTEKWVARGKMVVTTKLEQIATIE